MLAAARPRRAGFPTARLVLGVALILGSAAPAHATFLPPPWRLAILFDRDVWAPPPALDRPVPVRPGMDPIAFEEHAHG